MELAEQKMPSLPTTQEIIAHLDQYVLGQVRAKRDLAVVIYNHYMAQAYRDTGEVAYEDFGKQHILFLGPSGSGKTLLVRTAARMLGGEKIYLKIKNLLPQRSQRAQRIQRILHTMS